MRKSLMVIVLVTSVTFVGCTYRSASHTAFGRTWKFLGVTTEKVQCFYDPKTISYSYHIIKFEVRIVDQLGYEGVGWQEVDCARNEFRGFNFTMYDKYYRLVDPQPPDAPWMSIPASSAVEKFKNKYCR